MGSSNDDGVVAVVNTIDGATEDFPERLALLGSSRMCDTSDSLRVSRCGIRAESYIAPLLNLETGKGSAKDRV